MKCRELKERISVLLAERRELSLRLRTIALDTVSIIRDIEADSGDGSYYIASPQYLLSRLENIYAVTGCVPPAAPVKPLVKSAEPAKVERETIGGYQAAAPVVTEKTYETGLPAVPAKAVEMTMPIAGGLRYYFFSAKKTDGERVRRVSFVACPRFFGWVAPFGRAVPLQR